MSNFVKNPTKVVTGPNTVMSYANLNYPKAPVNGGKEKYSVSLVISKDDTDTINKINAAIKAAYNDGQKVLQDKSGNVPSFDMIKNPLRDGDKERPHDKVYKNSYFINANSVKKPGVVDANLNPILSTAEIYSGIIGRASINFYAYNVNGNRGIACGLNNVMKLRDGAHLGGQTSAEDDFADFSDGDSFLD